MNSLSLQCGPVHRTGTRRLRGSDDGDGVPGWCSSPLSNASQKKAKARFAWKFGFGANAVLLAILMVISCMMAPVAAELTVNRPTRSSKTMEVDSKTVSAVTHLKNVNVQRTLSSSAEALEAGDCLVVRFSPVDVYAADTYGPNGEPGPFNEELS